MKKKYYFFALALVGFIAFAIHSCVKDEPIDELKKLELSASEFQIHVGESVDFFVKVDNKLIAADVYINNTKIIGATYIFDKIGTYNVVAKLNGYIDSDEITITVTEKPKLTLASSATTLFRGESATFTVTSGGQSIAADIYVNGSKITGTSYLFNNVGTFKVQAKRDGYVDSDEITITVTEKPKLTLSASAITLFRGESATFTVTSGGQSVTADMYVNGSKITGTIYTFNNVGTFKVQAKRDGYVDSDEITITVTEKPKLTLASSATNLFRGESATFTVTSGGQSVTADIYVNGSKITGSTYTFNNVGTFKVQAKRDGYVDSDEITITVTDKPKLTLSASATTLFRGESATFTVTSGGQSIAADIYVNGSKITGTSYLFNNVGTFKVQAKRDGYVDSDEITITVTEKPKLTLASSATTLFRGESATFTVTSGGQSIAADIYVNGSKITGTSYLFNNVGTFKVQAKRDGYVDSDEITITVTEKPKLTLASSATTLFRGESATFTITSGGQSVTADIYVNGSKITGTTYTFNNVGSYKVQAKRDGYVDSDEITITVTEKPKLTLASSATTLFRGESATFTVTSGGQSVTADMYVNGSKITGTTYTFNNVGTFKVQAKRDGYVDSDEITITVREIEYQTDVYVAGYEVLGASQVAKYWKNGTAVPLTSGTTNAYANSIFVYNDDVFVAGVEELNNDITVAKYWKNGAVVTLSNTSNNAEATSIYVYNGDVYVAGFEIEGLTAVAKYWKNGTPVRLGSSSANSYAFSIYVDNGVVYVAGREEENGVEVAKYWRNGASNKLTNGNNDATAYSIYVNNNTVYVAGREYNGTVDVAKYWRNGTSYTLSSSSNQATAYSVFYSNGSVYVAGTDGDVAKYWRNGAANTLSGGTGANSIFVHEGDIYVAGYEYNGEVFVAKYWKNGQPTSLTNGINFAYGYSVFIYKYLVE